MNKTLILLLTMTTLALGCPKIKVVNKTKTPFNSHDGKQIFVAAKRCPNLYSDAKCLIEFRKTGENAYQAICGAKR